MPDTAPNSHQPPEERFLAWVDALVDPAEAIPVPDADLAALAGTAAFVQRVAGPGSAPSLSTDRTETMWEEIMHTASTTATLTPTIPASDGARPIAPRALPSAPAAGWRSWLPTALLIAALVVAGLAAAWRIAGPFDLAPGGGGPETANQPGIAGSATPAASANGCPLTSDMPVFVGEAPEGVADLGMTYAQVQPDSDFVIACPGVEHPEPLLTGVVNAQSLPWPGTVMLELVGGDAVALNIATGERIALGPDAAPGGIWSFDSSPWLLTPNNAAYTDWRITNLKTMSSMALSDEIGGVLPNDFYPRLASQPGSSYAIITQSPEYGRSNPTGNSQDAIIAELPASALVIDETLTTRRWIDNWGQVAVGVDSVAYQTQVDAQPMIRVEDAETGDDLMDITGVNFNGPPGQRFAVIGESVVYVTDGELWLADASSRGSRSAQVEIGDMQALAVYPTGVPGRVLVEWNADDAGTAAAPSSLLDVATGGLLPVQGLVPIVGPGGPGEIAHQDYLLTLAPSPDSEAQSVARLTDIATGEVVLTSEPIDASISDLLASTRIQPTASGSGAIAVVTGPNGEAVVLDATTDTVTTIAPPEFDNANEAQDLQWSVMSSHDGLSLYAIGFPVPDESAGIDIRSPSDPLRAGDFAIAVMSTDPQWSAPLGFIPAGIIHGIPTDTDDDPAVLEAQEFATPAPDAASASQDAASCDLTNDMPVFVGSAPDVPFPDTYALLGDDGTLALVCGESSEVVATGVARVVPTGWPGAIAIETSDGSTELRNITNGATVQVESVDLLDALDSPLGDPYVVAGAPHSPWLVSAANADGTDWRITDLRTMESMLLSDDFGGGITVPLLPTFQTGFEAFSDRSNGNAVAVVSFQAEERPTEADLAVAAPWPGNAVVLPGSLADRRWIDSWPAFGLSLVPSASVSADGMLLAYFSPTDTDDLTIRVETAVDGDLLAEVPIERDGDDFSFSTQLILLAGGEPRLIYSDGTSVEIISWDPEIDRTVIAADALPRAITTLLPTADPDIVVVSGGTQAVTLDLATGRIGEAYDYVARPQTLAQFVDGDSHLVNLITFQSDSPAGVPATIRVVDPVSGEVLVESEPVDINPTALAGGGNVNSLARDGTLAVVPIDDGRAIVLDADSGETWEIARPVDGVEQWLFLPSEDGRLIYAISRERYATGEDAPFFITAASPGGEWAEVGAGSPTRSIVGTHDLPGAEPDAPAVLEAQEFATPAASPVAVVATCALDGDIPVVIGADLDLPGTVLRLVDGTLTLECDEAPTVVAEDVAEVVPGSTWPGAVLLHMGDGSLRGVNLRTGAEGDLGAFPADFIGASVRTTRWVFFPTTPEQLDWRIIDLETMDSLLLSDELGGVLPHSTVAHLWATTPDAAVIGFGGTPVLPPGTGSFGLGATPAAGTPVAEPPAEWSALVFDGSLDNRRWIDLNIPYPSLMPAAISPDGKLLAIEQASGDRRTIRVERLSDGALVVETGIDLSSADSFLVLDDALLHLTPERLDRVTWDDDGNVAVDTLIAFDAPAGVPVLVQTTEPGTVIVGGSTPSGDSAGYLVDVASGEVTEVPGMLQTPFYSAQYNDGLPVGYVLAAVPAGEPARTIVQLIDVATGQPVVASEALDLAPADLVAQPAALRRGGEAGFVFLPDGRAVVLDAVSGEASTIEPPESGGGWTYASTSPAGDALVLARPTGQAYVRQVAPSADWIEITQRTFVTFVPGAGTLLAPRG